MKKFVKAKVLSYEPFDHGIFCGYVMAQIIDTQQIKRIKVVYEKKPNDTIELVQFEKDK
jgi:hypothetical protein